MNGVLSQFKKNIGYARELGSIAGAIKGITTPVLDVDDILRAQIVFAVSALDYFVHETVRVGMLEIEAGKRAQTKKYEQFQIPISTAKLAINGVPCTIWLDKVVKDKHAWISFQDPDKIADAIRLISQKTLWDEVGLEHSMPGADAKKNLKLIIDRRNKIAHEADMDPTNTGFRWPINMSQAEDTIIFIEKVANAIFKVVVSP